MYKLVLLLTILGLGVLSAPVAADTGCPVLRAEGIASGATACAADIAETCPPAYASMSGVGLREVESPFSGAIRFRTEYGSTERINSLSHRLDFDLHFTQRIADGVRLNLQLGSGDDWRGTDVIGNRRHRLKRAFAQFRFNEPDCE